MKRTVKSISLKFGNVMSEKGVKLNPGKVKAIVELPAPKNVSEMHQLFRLQNSRFSSQNQ